MPTTTEAYVARPGNGPNIKLETVHYKDLGTHEVLVDAVAVSMCHTDIRAAAGGFFLKPPMILGHESGGYIKAVGSGVSSSLKVGDPVVLSYASCGTCRRCLSGKNAYCDKLMELNFSGRSVDGSVAATDADGEALNSHFFGQSSMSRVILAHEMNVVRIEGNVTREELQKFSALGCGIQTGCGAIFNVLRPPPHSTIAIFGGGAVGLSACIAASLTSPQHLILLDVSDEKLSIIPSSIIPGLQTINSGKLSEPVSSHLLKITNGEGFDYIIDAVGNPEVVGEAHKALAKLGTLLTLGGNPNQPQFAIEQHLVKGVTYRGTHQGDSVPKIMIPFMIELWRQGKFPFDQLLSFFKFEELQKAIEETHAGRIIKPVLVM